MTSIQVLVLYTFSALIKKFSTNPLIIHLIYYSVNNTYIYECAYRQVKKGSFSSVVEKTIQYYGPLHTKGCRIKYTPYNTLYPSLFLNKATVT